MDVYILMMIEKPQALVGRDREWSALSGFATDTELGARLGLVYGRRRMGKTFMLDLLAEATGGFMFTAVEQSGRQNLRMLGGAYARFLGLRDTVDFASWQAAVEALLRLGERREEPTVVVLDEFPYLLDTDPSIASLLQIGLGPGAPAFRSGRTRLVLCGSAMATMRRLVSGTAPLRGRALLELVVPPFGYRDAARFWRLGDDPDLAFRVNALVGGTPAYQAMSGGTPAGRDFDDWVAEGLLNPASAMFREGNVLLYEQPGMADAALYFSVLAAIANGAAKRSEIGAVLGRSDNALGHPLAVLSDIGLVRKVEDALRARRPLYHLAEPVIRFHQLVIRPREAILSAGRGARVWADVVDTVASKVYGPHFETLAREWTLLHTSAVTFGGTANVVGPATLACRQHRAGHELDVVALSDVPHEPACVLAIGEAKATTSPVGVAELTRLEHLRGLVPTARVRDTIKLLIFARSGATSELAHVGAGRSDVEIVDLHRLYAGG